MAQHLSGYEQYFAMARGTKGAEALDMSKFFDTNYHYLVPELAASVVPKPDFSTFIAKARLFARAVFQLCRAQERSKAVQTFRSPLTSCTRTASEFSSRPCLLAGEARPGGAGQGAGGAHADRCVGALLRRA